MKKQPARRTKMGPCNPRMRHRFHSKHQAPAGYRVEMPGDYIMKRCINCGGRFWFHEPFTEALRNLTPSPDQIREVLVRFTALDDLELND